MPYALFSDPRSYVFQVQKQSDGIVIKTLHRNMKLPFFAIPGI